MTLPEPFSPKLRLGEQNCGRFLREMCRGEQNAEPFSPKLRLGEQNCGRFLREMCRGEQNAEPFSPKLRLDEQNCGRFLPKMRRGTENAARFRGTCVRVNKTAARFCRKYFVANKPPRKRSGVLGHRPKPCWKRERGWEREKTASEVEVFPSPTK